MTLRIENRQYVSSEIANEGILPIFQEWFDLSHTNEVLPEVEVEDLGTTGMVVKISLGKLVSREQYEELVEALTAAKAEL